MGNTRALAAVAAAVAALGLTTPVAVADGMGNGGGTDVGGVAIVPGGNGVLPVPVPGGILGNNGFLPGFNNGFNNGFGNNGFNNGFRPGFNNGFNNNGNRPGFNNGFNNNGNRPGFNNNGNRPGNDNGFNNNGNRPGNDNGFNNGFNNGLGLGNNNGLGLGNNNGLGLGNNNGLGLGNNNTFGPDNNLGNFARNIVIQPSVVAGGGRITITVDGCRGGGNASSRAFRTLPLVPVNGNSDTARGVATIDNNVRPGPYDVTADCNGRTLTRPNAFTVLGGVHGGVGGSISNGATPTDMAIGGGLVSSAVVGGCVFWLRRRLEKRI